METEGVGVMKDKNLKFCLRRLKSSTHQGGVGEGRVSFTH